MKLLLTSQMMYNKSIIDALSDLLQKPFSEAAVTYVITSHNGAMVDKSWFVQNLNSLYGLGWKRFYMIDVAGVDGLDKKAWMSQVEESDVIVMGGGANYILSYWLERSGLMDRLAELLSKRVYVGSSAGSMLAQPILCTSSQAMKSYSNGEWDVKLKNLGPPGRSSDRSLGLVNFLIRPHYGSEDKDFVTDKLLQQVADHFKLPVYAIDDQSAIKVDDDRVEVVTEGKWKKFDQ